MDATVSISTIVTGTMTAAILDASGAVIGTTQNNTGNTLSFTRTIPAGDYYLKITSTSPVNTNYQTPYNFIIGTTLSATNFDINKITAYPNPVNETLHIDHVDFEKAVCYNDLGQKVFEVQNQNNTIDCSSLSNGLYVIELQKGETKTYLKVIKE